MALLKDPKHLENLLYKLTDCELDATLGLKQAITCNGGIEKSESYSDGSTGPNALYTSYRDYFSLYKDLRERRVKSFAELGAGISRSKLLFDLLKAPFKTSTYEYVSPGCHS